MKTKTLTLICALTLVLTSATPAMAATNEPGAIVADLLVVRPACLVATVLGSAFFVLGLPVAAMSNSVQSSRQALVVLPAQATFRRPLGDVESLSDWTNNSF